jgi:hypothetical protein
MNIQTTEEYLNSDKLSHTLKLIPSSQRELFISEMAKQLKEREQALVDSLQDEMKKQREIAYQVCKEEIENKIGFLRQWLNEDRITKLDNLVTNDNIKEFLF